MKAVRYLKALSDETRLRLFSVLSEHELSVNEIVRVMDMGQSRVSRHLKILSDSGLVSSRRDGLWAFYTARDNGEARGLVQAVLRLNGDESLVTRDLGRASGVLEEREQRTLAFFESVASKWEDLKGGLLGDFDLNAEIRRRITPCRTIVDVGCGTGDLFAVIADQAPALIGVDRSPGMLSVARRRYQDQDHIQWRLGEIEHLPLGDGEADLAVVNMVLHHLGDPEQGLREASRILAPGGRLILAELAKHDQEVMREGHGDRWLGFEPAQIADWLAPCGVTVGDHRRYELEPPLAVIIYTAQKS